MRRLYHVPLAGVAYFSITVLLGVASAYRPNNLLIWAFAAMLAGVIVSGIISGGMLVRLQVTRTEPRTGRVGEPMSLRYIVRNAVRWWPLFDLSIDEAPVAGPRGWSGAGRSAPAWLLHAGPRETAHVEGMFVPMRRGRFRFEAIQAASAFPFGLLRKIVVFQQPAEVLVLPAIRSLKPGVLRLLAPQGLGGVRTTTRPGPGEDFLGVREYRPGDSPRQIAWRRRAGLDELATVERSTHAPPRLRVILDLTRATSMLRVAPGDDAPARARALEEDAITLVASLLAAADREGYEYALSLHGVDAPRTLLRRGHWHLQRLMALLAAIDLDAPRLPRPDGDREERAAVVHVHVDRVDLDEGREDSVHLAATRLGDLLA